MVVLVVKNLPAKAGDARDVGSGPGLGTCPGEGNGTRLQYSCLENSTGRGAWWVTVHGVTKSQMWMSTCTYSDLISIYWCINKCEALCGRIIRNKAWNTCSQFSLGNNKAYNLKYRKFDSVKGGVWGIRVSIRKGFIYPLRKNWSLERLVRPKNPFLHPLS